MSEPWTTKQHLWVKEQYNQGRKVMEAKVASVEIGEE